MPGTIGRTIARTSNTYYPTSKGGWAPASDSSYTISVVAFGTRNAIVTVSNSIVFHGTAKAALAFFKREKHPDTARCVKWKNLGVHAVRLAPFPKKR